MIVKLLADEYRTGEEELGFAELRRRTPGISKKMLSSTLRGLEQDGLVTRRVERTVPPHTHYGLTSLGVSLDTPLGELRHWAETHMAVIDDHARTWPGREG